MLESINLVRKGKVRRSKLYYLRQRSGKSARIAEKKDILKKKPKVAEAEAVSDKDVKEEGK
jgi:large subunit ribosomal protein L19